MPVNSKTVSIVLGAALTASIAIGGTLEVSWYTIDGGGVMSSTGGDFALSGTVGQPDAGIGIMTGGDFTLSGGFWAVQICPMVASDFDGDCDVDLDDFTTFEAAMNGPNQPPGAPAPDLDNDNDCDLNDFALFAADFTGVL